MINIGMQAYTCRCKYCIGLSIGEFVRLYNKFGSVEMLNTLGYTAMAPTSRDWEMEKVKERDGKVCSD